MRAALPPIFTFAFCLFTFDLYKLPTNSVNKKSMSSSTRRETIRIACGQGFWGDMLDAPVRQVNEGPIDYLMLDYLAAVTMSISQNQPARRPLAGYARDFVPLMREILPACVE